MTPFRPFERGDVPQVASLYERVSRSGSRSPAPGLGAYLERILLDHPWTDAEIPSLVYELDGRIVSFIGVHVRRLEFDGKPVRLAAFGQLVSDPDLRGRPGGALLLRHALAGPQDLTIAYFPSHLARMFESLGGHTNFLTSIGWIRALRPAGLVGELALRRANRPALASAIRPALSAAGGGGRHRVRSLMDSFLLGAPRRGGRPAAAATRVELLTPEAAVANLPAFTAWARIRPDYDEQSLAWLFDEMGAVSTRGELVRWLVRDSADAGLGWYVAYLDPQRIFRVMQVVAKPADAGTVLDHVFTYAESRGAVAVAGRLEPQLAAALWERQVLLRRVGRDVVHSRSQEVLDAVLRGDALITALEGETWMGHESSPVPQPPVHDTRP